MYASFVFIVLLRKYWDYVIEKKRESLNNSILTQIISLEKAKIAIFTWFENGMFRFGKL